MRSARRRPAAAVGFAAAAFVAWVAAPVTPVLADPKPLAATPLDAQVFAGGTEWDFTNECGTSNGLPTGGAEDSSLGLAVFDVTTTAATDAFDCGAMVWVGTTVVADDDGTVDVSPSGADVVLTPSTQTIDGLRVTDSYRMFASGDTARVLVDLENPTSAPISTTVSYASNFGSDDQTVLAGSSSGGATFTTADRWIVSADDPAAGSDLVNTTVLSGPGAPAVPSAVSSTVFDGTTTAGALARFDVTVPAGEKRSLLFFHVVTGGNKGTPNAAVVSSAAVWDTTPTASSSLLAGIAPADLGNVVNWALVAPAPAPPASVPTAPPAPVAAVPTFTG